MQSVASNFNISVFTLAYQVTNYHVVAKLAGDGSASHRCKVFYWYLALLSTKYTLMTNHLLFFPFKHFLPDGFCRCFWRILVAKVTQRKGG